MAPAEYSTFLMTDGRPAVTLRAIGGIVDLHIFAGPTPEDVNTQYSTVRTTGAWWGQTWLGPLGVGFEESMN